MNRLVDSPWEDFCEAFSRDEIIQSMLGHARNIPYLGWSLAGEWLYVLVRVLQPKTVVETGVAAGISSACILAALEANGVGELTSIDLPNNEASYMPSLGKRPIAMLARGERPGFLVPDELRSRWRLQIGDTRDLLVPLLRKLGKIDVFFHDSEHTYDAMMFEFENAWKHLSSDGLILTDNVTWNKAFPDFCRRHSLRVAYFWRADFAGARLRS